MMDRVLSDGLAMIASTLDRDFLSGRMKETLQLLEKYIDEIELFNQAYGLVKVKNREELAVKHILDSLSPLRVLTKLPALAADMVAGGDVRLGDVGSGAGLPGIPLAIALPAARVTLIERMGRRAGFLRNVQAALALRNVTVAEMEMEKHPPGEFDLLCFRAFRPLDARLLAALFRLLKPGGVLAAYKGRRDAVLAEMAGLEGLVGAWEAAPCPVPFLEEERHVVLISPPGTPASYILQERAREDV